MKESNHSCLNFFTLLFCFISLSNIISYLLGGVIPDAVKFLLFLAFVGLLVYVEYSGILQKRKILYLFRVLLVLGIGLSYYHSSNLKVVTKEESKVRELRGDILDVNMFSKPEIVILSDGHVVTVEGVKNRNDFKVGDEVYGIETVTETRTYTTVYGTTFSDKVQYTKLLGKNSKNK